jgi:hypothetical protein
VSDDELKHVFEETRRHFDVIPERLERRIDVVVESMTVLDEKKDRRIDELEHRMDRNSRRGVNLKVDSAFRAIGQPKRATDHLTIRVSPRAERSGRSLRILWAVLLPLVPADFVGHADPAGPEARWN